MTKHIALVAAVVAFLAAAQPLALVAGAALMMAEAVAGGAKS
jgi:hypothetical protein